MNAVKVFSDDNSGNASNSSSKNGSNKTDDSPAASILLEAAREVPVKEVTRIVNHIPDAYTSSHANEGDEDDDDDDDDDNRMTLQLPAQLKAMDPMDPNSDNLSQSSSLSSRSARSGLSAGTAGSGGGLRNFYGAANIKAQSARNKRDSQWGSSKNKKSPLSLVSSSSSVASSEASTQSSTDSAKYRSLLNQGDTNDAGLFGVKGAKSAAAGSNEDLGNKKGDSSSVKSNTSQLSSLNLLSNLIKSAEEDAPSPSPLSPTKKQPAARHFDDSDEEDVYVEADDDYDHDDGRDEKEGEDADNASVKSGASRVVQQLSSLLAMDFGGPSKTSEEADRSFEVIFNSVDASPDETTPVKSLETPTKSGVPGKDTTPSTANNSPSTANSEDGVNFSYDSTTSSDGGVGGVGIDKKLSFEVVDSSDDESNDEEKKYEYDEASPEWNALNMERLRRLSLTGYADTMASF